MTDLTSSAALGCRIFSRKLWNVSGGGSASPESAIACRARRDDRGPAAPIVEGARSRTSHFLVSGL